jgi:uncharacterized protein YuzE
MKEKYHYDKKSDSLYIVLRDGEEESFEEIVPGITVELDGKGEMIGIEILKASRFMKKPRKATTSK